MKRKLCISLLYMVSLLLFTGCMEPMEIPDAIPQERMRWQNPHRWGLEPDIDQYN